MSDRKMVEVSKDLRFAKMHGAGNDFVMIDDRESIFPVHNRDFIARLAVRRLGVGCEGVILVQKSDCADFRMRFFNPDGGEAEMCGNGARCVAAFARRIGAVHKDDMRFETIAGEVEAKLLGPETVRLAMPDPRYRGNNFAVVGVPHKIVPVNDLAVVDVDGEGRKIRYSEEFAPAGTNVDFVTYYPPNRADIRTYERGVEAESGACGTGSVAIAVVGVAEHGMSFPVTVKTIAGYELVIDGRFDKGVFSEITLTGPVKFVFEGVLDVDALAM